MSIITIIIKCVLFNCDQTNGEKISLSPILLAIRRVTIHSMLNFNGGNNGHEL